jgi:hypothetical protein
MKRRAQKRRKIVVANSSERTPDIKISQNPRVLAISKNYQLDDPSEKTKDLPEELA